MDWKTLIAELTEIGMTQAEIGAIAELSQPAISDLANGRTRDVRWSSGDRLRKLHAERCTSPTTPAKDAA